MGNGDKALSGSNPHLPKKQLAEHTLLVISLEWAY